MGMEKERHERIYGASDYICCCTKQINNDEIAHFKDHGICPRCTFKMEKDD